MKTYFLFTLCFWLTYHSSLCKEDHSWLEEEKEGARVLLNSFINNSTIPEPQELRSVGNRMYKLSLCFFKDEEDESNVPRFDPETTTSSPKGESLNQICSLPPDTGMCRASFTAYYFNPRKSDCFPFVYGGCGGNDNRFRSLEECKSRCASPRIVYPKRLLQA